MKEIIPAFRDDNDKIVVVAMFILSIFFFLFPALIVILCCKNQISESSYQIAKALLNFELLMFIVSLFCMIPIIGWIFGLIICPLLMIINVIVVIINMCAIAKQAPVKIPVMYEFI